MRKEEAEKIIQETTVAYNRISDHFSVTRAAPWPEFQFLEPYLGVGRRVLDVGCGNGRLMSFLEKFGVKYTGVDASERLVEIAKKRHHHSTLAPDFQVAGHTSLPFPDRSFDVVCSIASLHHVPSHALREQAARECFRVLAPGGTLFLITWNFWQPQFWPLHFQTLAQKIRGRSPLDCKDVFKPWKDSNGVILANRYCHAFTTRELATLVRNAGFAIVKRAYVQKAQESNILNARNIVAIAEKPKIRPA